MAIDLANIGHALCALGRSEEALPLYEKALAIVEDSNSTFRIIHLNSIAYALMNTGQPEKAQTEQRRALARIRSVFDPHHPATAVYVSNLGEIADALGQHEEALFLRNATADIVATVYGHDTPPPIIQLNALGYGMSADRRPLDFTAP